MAIVEPLRICLRCGDLLIGGACPNGHEIGVDMGDKWPERITRPITFTEQRRTLASKKSTDKEEAARQSIIDNAEINRAMRLLEDKYVLDMLNDVALLVSQALVHKRSDTTLSRMMQISQHLSDMAKATDSYVKYCKNTRIPE